MIDDQLTIHERNTRAPFLLEVHFHHLATFFDFVLNVITQNGPVRCEFTSFPSTLFGSPSKRKFDLADWMMSLKLPCHT